MNILSREDLRNHIKKGEFAPVYLLFGAEKYLRDLASKTIADKVLHDAPLREFNETAISLNDTELAHALASAEQLPMISSRRVVRITEAQKIKESDEDALNLYLNRPAEHSVVIFVADDLDKRRRFAKSLLEKSVAVEFNVLSDNELLLWAKQKLKDLDAQADDNALRQIVGLVGSNVQRLTSEIEKLATAALPDKLITFELVEQLVPNSRELSNFELTDYLMSRDRPRALRILKKILDDGAEPLMLLGLIASNFRRLLHAKELMRQGVERTEVARAMKLPYSKQEEFLKSARHADGEYLARVLKRIAATDLAIKTSKATPRLQIEMLVAELAN